MAHSLSFFSTSGNKFPGFTWHAAWRRAAAAVTAFVAKTSSNSFGRAKEAQPVAPKATEPETPDSAQYAANRKNVPPPAMKLTFRSEKFVVTKRAAREAKSFGFSKKQLQCLLREGKTSWSGGLQQIAMTRKRASAVRSQIDDNDLDALIGFAALLDPGRHTVVTVVRL